MTKLPLQGLRIIEIGSVLSLPYAAALLGDLGADVIKIEGPGRIDVTRQGPFAGGHPDNEPGPDPWNRASTYHLLNRGKKSLALDLSRPEGREVLKDLIRVSDILMENFTPRVMRGWGLDFPNARKLRPNLIMVSNSGYGRGGPYEQYPAQATTQEATHGLAFVIGYRGDIPSKAGQSYVDFLAAWACVMATLLGLRYRNRFGRGIWVDAAMYQLGAFNISEYILDWMANKRLPQRIGNRHPWYAPQGCYPCLGKNQWCVLVARDDEEWGKLCHSMGIPQLAEDARFARNKDRIVHHDEIDAIISMWTKERSKLEITELLQEAGIPAGPVLDIGEVNLDPQLRSRGFFQEIKFSLESRIGRRMIVGRPWRLGSTPVAVKGPGPRLGENNQEIVQGILGYSPDRYSELENAGIIGTTPTKPLKVQRVDMDERVRQGRLARWDPDFKKHLGILD